MASATTIANLLVRLSGDTSAFEQKMSGALGTAQKFGKQMQSVGKKLTVGVTVPMVGMATVAAKTAIDFDKAMMGVNSVLKLSGEEFGAMKEEVLDFSTTTSQSSASVAESLRGIVSSGFEAGDAMEILRVTVDAAGNMMTDTATTTRAMTSVLQAFGMEATEVTHVADVMETAANSSALQFDELTSSIGTVTGTANAAGVSFEEVTAGLMTIADAGFGAAEGTTALNSLLTTMLKPTDELADAIESWGYASGEAALQAEGLEGVIRLLMETTGGSASEMANMLGNIRAQRAAFALSRDAGDAFADSLREVGAASEGVGEHAKMADVRHQSWAYTLTKLKSEIEVIAIRIGNQFVPALIEIAAKIKDIATEIANWDPSQFQAILTPLMTMIDILAKVIDYIGGMSEETLVVIGQIVAWTAALAPLLMILGKLVSVGTSVVGVIGPLIGSIGGLSAAALSGEAALAAMGGGAAAAGAGLAATLGPIALVVGALGGLFLAIKKISDAERERGVVVNSGIHVHESQRQQVEASIDANEEEAQSVWKVVKALWEKAKAQSEVSSSSGTYAGEQKRQAEEQLRQSIELKQAWREEENALKALQEETNRLALERGRAAEADRLTALARSQIVEVNKEVEKSQEDLTAAIDIYEAAISGSVGKAQEEFRESYEDLTGQMEEVESEIDRVKKALEEAAPGTQAYKDLQGELGNLQGKYGELQGAIGNVAAAHEEAIQSIIFGFVQAQLAADGFTADELRFLSALGREWGIYDEASSAALTSVIGLIEEHQGKLDELVEDGKLTAEAAEEFGQIMVDAQDDTAAAYNKAADEAEAAALRMGGAMENASNDTRMLDDAAGILDGTVEGLGGTAVKTAGDVGLLGTKARDAAGEIDDLGSAILRLPDGKTINIKVLTTHQGGAGGPDAGFEEVWHSRPHFPFQEALENLVEYAKAHTVDIGIKFPTKALKEFEEGIQAIADALNSLTDLADALKGLRALDVTPAATGLGAITMTIDNLMDWTHALIDRLDELNASDMLPDISDSFEDTLSEVQAAVDSLDRLLGGLVSLGNTLRDVLGTEILPGPRDYDAFFTSEFYHIRKFIGRMLTWASVLHEELASMVDQTLPSLDTALSDAMDAIADATGSLTGLMGELLDFLETLREVGGGSSSTFTKLSLAEITIHFGDLMAWVRSLSDWLSKLALIYLPDLTEEAQAAMDAMTDATSRLTDLMGELLDFLETLREVGGGSSSTFTKLSLAEIIIHFGDLMAWVRSLSLWLSDLALIYLPDLSEEAEAALDGMIVATETINDLMGALLSFGETLQRLDESAGVPTLTADVLDALEQAVRDLWDRFSAIANDLLPELTEDAVAQLQRWEAFSDAVSAVFGPFEDALGFLEALTNSVRGELSEDILDELSGAITDAWAKFKWLANTLLPALSDAVLEQLGRWEAFADAASEIFRPFEAALGFLEALASSVRGELTEDLLDALERAIRDVWGAIETLADDLLPEAMEDVESLTDRMDEFASTAARLFDPFEAMFGVIGSIAELGRVKMAQALQDFIALIPQMKVLIKRVADAMVALANQMLTDWAEGASEIAAKSQEASETVDAAFGGLSSAIGAMNSLVDLMYKLAGLTGQTTRLTGADFSALAWGMQMFLGVLVQALNSLQRATANLDTDALGDLGGDLRDISDGLAAMIETMGAVAENVGSADAGLDTLASAVEDAGAVLESALDALSTLLETPPWDGLSWYDFGFGLVETMVRGIQDALPDLEAVLQYIRDLLPSSPAKSGPLSKPIDWGFLSDGLAETMGYIRAQMSLPDLAGAGAGGATRSYNMTFNYPPNTELDLKRQMELIELTDRYKQ